MDIFHPGGPRGFVPDLLNPEEKPGFCKAAVELTQGRRERKCPQPSHSGTSRALREALRVSSGHTLLPCLQPGPAAQGHELLLLGQEHLHCSSLEEFYTH